MPPPIRLPSVFDQLLGFLENFANTNAIEILTREAMVSAEIAAPIHHGLENATSRSAQFKLIQTAVDLGIELFKKTVKDISKETLMSIARRAPSTFLDGSDLLLATLIAKYAVSRPENSFETTTADGEGLAILATPEELYGVFRLMGIAKSTNRLGNMARWVGKGAKLRAVGNQFTLEIPETVRTAVGNYERRRPKSAFGSNGFFAPQPDPAKWSEYRVPTLLQWGKELYFESPKGSDRWIAFEKWPSMLDGGGLMRLLRGYDEALKESWGVGADHVVHFLTALATLIDHESPVIAESADGEARFDPGSSPAEFEHKLGFAFGLARKGFLRLPRNSIVKNIARVVTVIAPESETGERIAEEFIDAFLFNPTEAEQAGAWTQRYTPFIHASTNGYLYIDVLLLWDFLTSILEHGKEWYASQHGDRFVLDLKRWLDVEAPSSVADSRRSIRLPDSGAKSDIDLLVKSPSGLLVVECKAYGKSPDFMAGAPDAISERRARIREATRQADRIAETFAAEVKAGKTEFAADTAIRAAVCTPSVEFLLPLEEFGMLSAGIPRVATPEELLEFTVAGKRVGPQR